MVMTVVCLMILTVFLLLDEEEEELSRVLLLVLLLLLVKVEEEELDLRGTFFGLALGGFLLVARLVVLDVLVVVTSPRVVLVRRAGPGCSKLKRGLPVPSSFSS